MDITTTCHDCKKDTYEDPKDYFMVTFDLWEQYGAGKDLLCVDCMEHRIGHKLQKEDLLDCPLNTQINPHTKAILEV